MGVGILQSNNNDKEECVLWALESCNRITMIRKSVVGVGILRSNNNDKEECVCGRWNLAIE